jgi:sulfotransferase
LTGAGLGWRSRACVNLGRHTLDNKIHFISGLPRAGSTLLAAILRQNPAFSAAMTSPVGALYMALEMAMSRRNETSVFLDAGKRRALLRGVFAGYYHDADPATVLFDTNRLWCARLPALAELFPQSRVICCVREVAWIVDSLERQAQRNPFELSGLFGYEPGGTLYTRVARVSANDGMVGYALDALREACAGEHSGRLILLDYEALARAPEPTMHELYRLLGEPRYSHDFENVAYEANDFDAALGAPGLHRVRGRVEWRPRPTVLPSDLFERFAGDSFWRKPQARLAHVPAILWHG